MEETEVEGQRRKEKNKEEEKQLTNSGKGREEIKKGVERMKKNIGEQVWEE